MRALPRGLGGRLQRRRPGLRAASCPACSRPVCWCCCSASGPCSACSGMVRSNIIGSEYAPQRGREPALGQPAHAPGRHPGRHRPRGPAGGGHPLGQDPLPRDQDPLHLGRRGGLRRRRALGEHRHRAGGQGSTAPARSGRSRARCGELDDDAPGRLPDHQPPQRPGRRRATTSASAWSGPIPGVLGQLADQYEGVLRRVPGIVEINNSGQAGQPEMRATVNRNALSDLGVTSTTVSQAMRTAIQGSRRHPAAGRGSDPGGRARDGPPGPRRHAGQPGGDPHPLQPRCAGAPRAGGQGGEQHRALADQPLRPQPLGRASAGSSPGAPSGDVARDVRAAQRDVPLPAGYRAIVGGGAQPARPRRDRPGQRPEPVRRPDVHADGGALRVLPLPLDRAASRCPWP